MLELSGDPGESVPDQGSMTLRFGGDTLNTAVYLARLGVHSAYVTALGDDGMSDWMVRQWQSEGVDCTYVRRLPDSVPGLYMIRVDNLGERSFLYWRDQAPVRRFFEDESQVIKLFESLNGFDWVYLSGITLALFNNADREKLLARLERYREQGGKIAFDGNYRPRLWEDHREARVAFERAYRMSELALPTVDDEVLLFGDDDSEAVARRLQNLGVPEIVLKIGPDGCIVIANSIKEPVPTRAVTVKDTTAAGDSFNAGYLAARCRGDEPVLAARAGHRLASTVIQYSGAIIPKRAMPVSSD